MPRESTVLTRHYLSTKDLEDYGRACNAVIALYEQVLEREKTIASNVLRYGFCATE